MCTKFGIYVFITTCIRWKLSPIRPDLRIHQMFVWLSNLRYQYLSKYYYIDKRAYLFTTLDLRTLQTSFGCTQRPHRCRLFLLQLDLWTLRTSAPNGHGGAGAPWWFLLYLDKTFFYSLFQPNPLKFYLELWVVLHPSPLFVPFYPNNNCTRLRIWEIKRIVTL